MHHHCFFELVKKMLRRQNKLLFGVSLSQFLEKVKMFYGDVAEIIPPQMYFSTIIFFYVVSVHT